jgi:hypothetical protein
MTDAQSTPAVACDLSEAPDTGPERMAEYARFLDTAFISRERTPDAMSWRLQAGPGIEAWARDLAARENACCAFMTHTISVADGQVSWHATTIDDPSARAVLDLFYDLPVRRWNSVDAVEERWQELAVPVLIREGDLTRVATRAEIRNGRTSGD